MPSQQLFQIIPVTVGAGATIPFSHNMNINGIPVRPDRVEFDTTAAGLVVTATTTTTITINNPTGAPLTGNVLLEVWHSMLRAFGIGSSNGFATLSPQPFVVGGGGGGGGSTGDPETFVYVATGLEGSDFFVPLPAARSTDAYNVFAQQDGVTAILGIDCPNIVVGDRTTVDFRVVTSAAVTAGDRLAFFIFDL